MRAEWISGKLREEYRRRLICDDIYNRGTGILANLRCILEIAGWQLLSRIDAGMKNKRVGS